ncbi:MAG: hypothetical protein NDJ90_07630 [Oligoflexia bacterium]|nr:hypothetical protein [Oligoflexia bacterium]
MLKKLAVAVALFTVFAGSSAWAKSESWYFNIGLGYGIPQYPGDVESSLNDLKSLGASNTPIAIDLGFYWPVADTTVLGASINGISDSYDLVITNMSVIQTGIFLSGMHFFGIEPGTGPYLRGDVGAGRAAVTLGSLDAASEYGFGLGGGVGYGIPVGDETRILLQATYMYRAVEGQNYGATAFTVGGFF